MSKEVKPIVLKARTVGDNVGVVRLSSEAEKVVRRLSRRSGLPIRSIVSEIIIQSENLIDIDQSAYPDNEL